MDLQELIKIKLRQLREQGVTQKEVRERAAEHGIYIPTAARLAQLRKNSPRMMKVPTRQTIDGLAHLLRVSTDQVYRACLHTIDARLAESSDGDRFIVISGHNRTKAQVEFLVQVAQEALRQAEADLGRMEQ